MRSDVIFRTFPEGRRRTDRCSPFFLTDSAREMFELARAKLLSVDISFLSNFRTLETDLHQVRYENWFGTTLTSIC
jgi:hypothetical protein